MTKDAEVGTLADGKLLWQPSDVAIAASNIGRYLGWLEEERGLRFRDYEALWSWSVSDLEGFWSSIWDFFAVQSHHSYRRVLEEVRMPGAEWFPGATLNYAEHALRRHDNAPAVVAASETRSTVTISYAELHRQVAALAASLKRLGVGRGDRVAAYLPNIPEALTAFLATASLGAVWASCPPEFGARSVADRFRQIEPRLLFAVDGYRFKGRPHDRLSEVMQLRAELPTVEHLVMVPYLYDTSTPNSDPRTLAWAELLAHPASLVFEPVPFAHPLWVLYSSGTTGLPKPIVQGHGGILLEHLKTLALHLDIGPTDRLFWYTTTGWMMWNFLVSGLLRGATLLLYDGHAAHPDLGHLWRFAAETGMTYFGTSSPYLHACQKAGLAPGREANLGALRGLGSTAAPLAPDAFEWVYQAIKPDLLLNPFSGGTDLCTGIVGACPLVPVHAGEIPCRLLGAAVEAYHQEGRPVLNEVGELVITKPMPSMPVRFWNDPGDRRYRESYFEMFPGVWRHGDWIRITERGSCVIYGRSDSTLNRGGVRMGTSEFYRAVEILPEVADSLVIDTGELGREGKLMMFVVLAPGATLDGGLRARIQKRLFQELSPRHVPDEIHAVAEVPYTLNGKKVEVPVKRILLGTPLERAVSPGAIANPGCLQYFVEFARNSDQRSVVSAPKGG